MPDVLDGFVRLREDTGGETFPVDGGDSGSAGVPFVQSAQLDAQEGVSYHLQSAGDGKYASLWIENAITGEVVAGDPARKAVKMRKGLGRLYYYDQRSHTYRYPSRRY